MADHFQVFMPDILAAQEAFQDKINALQASADDIAGIMGDVGGAPGGADSVDGVRGMLAALKRLEDDVNSLPDHVVAGFDKIGGWYVVDDRHHGSGEWRGPGGKFPGGKPGGKNGDGKNGGDHPHDGGKPHGDHGKPHDEGDDENQEPIDETNTTGTDSTDNPQPVPPTPIEPQSPLDGTEPINGEGIVPPVPPGQQDKTEEDEEAEEEVEEVEEATPEYVSAANAPLKKELDEKQALLENTQETLKDMKGQFDQKQDRLNRLEAAFRSNHDPKLADQINQLRVEVAQLDMNISNDQQLVDSLGGEVQELAKRWSFAALPPGANIEKIMALENGKTSQWILDATRSEDNSVNCVNYVCNRMPIPGELPLNAHMWDEQANKFATELGIKVGDVPLEGSIIVMEREHSYANDTYGHVMYVEKVENGIVWVTDNTYPDKMVRLDHLTNELSGPNIHYLYCPWQVKA